MFHNTKWFIATKTPKSVPTTLHTFAYAGLLRRGQEKIRAKSAPAENQIRAKTAPTSREKKIKPQYRS